MHRSRRRRELRDAAEPKRRRLVTIGCSGRGNVIGGMVWLAGITCDHGRDADGAFGQIDVSQRRRLRPNDMPVLLKLETLKPGFGGFLRRLASPLCTL
jgi:hypothetical protein